MKRALFPLILVPLLGCSTTAPRPTPPVGTDANAASQAEIKELRDQIATLTSRVNHLHSELIAMQPEGEFRRLTIASVSDVGLDAGRPQISAPERSYALTARILLCNVSEWNGYGRMLRFTRIADPKFMLEAPGHDSIEAAIAPGGVYAENGEHRAVMLSYDRDLEPGVAYTLHPRNNVPDYTWVVNDGVQFRAPASAQPAR